MTEFGMNRAVSELQHKFYQQVQFLNSLEYQQVVDLFEKDGIKGNMKDGFSCAITEWLKMKLSDVAPKLNKWRICTSSVIRLEVDITMIELQRGALACLHPQTQIDRCPSYITREEVISLNLAARRPLQDFIHDFDNYQLPQFVKEPKVKLVEENKDYVHDTINEAQVLADVKQIVDNAEVLDPSPDQVGELILNP